MGIFFMYCKWRMLRPVDEMLSIAYNTERFVQVLAYLEAFAEEFDLLHLIRFQHRVTRVRLKTGSFQNSSLPVLPSWNHEKCLRNAAIKLPACSMKFLVLQAFACLQRMAGEGSVCLSGSSLVLILKIVARM